LLNDLPLSLIWLVLVVVFGIIEALTLGLVTIWLAVGALIAMIFSLIGIPVQFQIIVFIISSSALLYFTKPILEKVLKFKIQRTNADRIIGEKGIVIERIDTNNNTGQVRVKGQIWTARAFDENDIEVDQIIEVERISGVKLLVKKIT